MEEGWLRLCLIGVSTLLVLCFVKLLSKPKKRLPPGPWTLPFIGSLHHVIGGLPHRKMMEMSRRHGPLMHLMVGEIPTVVVSSAEAAALVMKTNDLAFASRPCSVTQGIVGLDGAGIVFGTYGDRWRQMRKICVVELMGPKQARRMDGIKTKEVEQLLQSLAVGGGATVNMSRKLSAISVDVVTRAVFGGTFKQQDEYLHELNNILKLLRGFTLADLFPSSRLMRWLSNGERDMRRTSGCMNRIIASVIDGRKAARAPNQGAAGDEDLLDVLLRLQEEDSLAFPLTPEIIGVVIFDIFAAATDATASVLDWTMSELSRNPKVMAKAQSEVREVLGQDRGVITTTDLTELYYMRMVIKEVLRLHPPGPLLVPRETREDCEIMGYHIPKGTNVHVNVFAISRDPKYWDNPEEFKPERFEEKKVDYYGTHFEFTPFGAGRRQCPGMSFGALTVEIVLANLLYHFNWMLPNGIVPESLDMSEKFGITASRMCELQLIATPYPQSKAVSI
ncbi:premnaspirodiene oxygenase [Lolium perenne]|jgi:cytochrome P450|uniref:premnaspirodiene oxygenase n=1 Tax=Lolium perenne TaxID=4522 RepID=UPI0021F68DEB|nr:premnaspirodiene oxygenase-like [Lolium perenne]